MIACIMAFLAGMVVGSLVNGIDRDSQYKEGENERNIDE